MSLCRMPHQLSTAQPESALPGEVTDRGTEDGSANRAGTPDPLEVTRGTSIRFETRHR